MFTLSCLEIPRAKQVQAPLYDKKKKKKLNLRNTDPPQVTIIHKIHDQLLNDSDRQAEKLLLWQARCE